MSILKVKATCVECKSSFEQEVEGNDIKLKPCPNCGCNKIDIEVITD